MFHVEQLKLKVMKAEVEKLRNSLLSSAEIDICIYELKHDLNIINEWLVNQSTLMKVSLSKSDFVNGKFMTIKGEFEKAKQRKEFLKERIQVLKLEKRIYCN